MDFTSGRVCSISLSYSLQGYGSGTLGIGKDEENPDKMGRGQVALRQKRLGLHRPL